MDADDRKAGDSDDGLGELARLPTHVAHEFVDWRPGRCNEKSPITQEREPSSTELSEGEMRYLRVIVNKPGEMSSAYAKMARVSARKAQEMRKRLVGLGYMREHEVNTAGSGRPSIILEPTALGIKKLEEES